MNKQFIVVSMSNETGETNFSLVRTAQVPLSETCPCYPLVGFYATEAALHVPGDTVISEENAALLLEYEDKASEHLIKFRECCEYCPKYKTSCAAHCYECFIDSCYDVENDNVRYCDEVGYGIDESLTTRILYLTP